MKKEIAIELGKAVVSAGTGFALSQVVAKGLDKILFKQIQETDMTEEELEKYYAHSNKKIAVVCGAQLTTSAIGSFGTRFILDTIIK